MSLLSLNLLVDDLLKDKIGNALGFPIKLNHINFFFFYRKKLNYIIELGVLNFSCY